MNASGRIMIDLISCATVGDELRKSACGNDLVVKPWPDGDLAKANNGLPLTFMQC